MKARNSNRLLIGVALVTGLVVLVVGVLFMTRWAESSKQKSLAAQRSAYISSSTAAKKAARASKKAAASLDAKRLKEEPLYQKYKPYGLTFDEIEAAKKLPVTFIGDSVMLGSQYGLEELFPQATVDAKVSRQVQDGLPILQDLKQTGKLAPAIVVGLGTNGPLTKADINAYMTAAGKRRVFWLTARAPDAQWIAENNKELATATHRYKNLTLIDWAEDSQGHPDWLTADGTHPEVLGQKYYYTLIVKTVVANAKQAR